MSVGGRHPEGGGSGPGDGGGVPLQPAVVGGEEARGARGDQGGEDGSGASEARKTWDEERRQLTRENYENLRLLHGLHKKYVKQCDGGSTPPSS